MGSYCLYGYFNNEAEPLSKKQVQWGCSCNILAGCLLETGKVRQFLTAEAFLLSGTEAMICFDRIICRIDILIACLGTSSTEPNQPSPICCCLQAISRFTTK